MDSAILYSVYAFTVIFSTISIAQPEGTCQASNCQFSNIKALDQLIESKIVSGKLAT